ncbi:MAG: hypothetical protein K0R14_888 [Burkholderiales bacterium]|jgi:hypothetical protein|nr:hypothetical protein [Burkholderiales bacterium]
MKYRIIAFLSILILSVFYIIHSRDASLQKPLHTQHKLSKINGYWQNLWLGTHKLLGGLYLGQNKISPIDIESGTYHDIRSTKTQDISGKKQNSNNESLTLGPVLDGNSSATNKSENQATADESGTQDYIYISENGANDVIRCKLGENQVSDCAIVLNNLSGPENMAIINSRFYLVNYNQPIMYSCGLSNSGMVESCAQMDIPINNPAYVVLDHYSLFISDMNFAKMAQCSLTSDYSVKNCTAILPTVSQNSFVVSTVNGYQYSITFDPHRDYMGAVNKCAGSLCGIMYDVNLGNLTTVKFLNNTAYILDYNSNSLVSCKLQPNGDFMPCNVLKSGLRLATGVAFYSYSS